MRKITRAGRPRFPGEQARPRAAFLFAPALALALTGCACSAEAALGEVLGLSAEPPVFTGWKAITAVEIGFQFSRPVTVKSVRLDPPVEIAGVSGGSEVVLVLEEARSGGARMTADLVVEDRYGNTLNVLTGFRTRNDNMPEIIINEVRTEYSNPKTEFIEFYTRRAGNLGGMRLYLTGTPEDTPFYEFPPVDVGAGEYIVLHLRTLDEESRDETGGSLAFCPATSGNEAQPTARDLWIPGAKKHINKRGQAVYLLDQDDGVLDALLFQENRNGGWANDKLAAAAEFLGNAGAWGTGAAMEGGIGPLDAASSANTTTSRTISRRAGSDTNTAGDWYITVTSGATPGRPNNPGAYTPK